MKDSLGTFGNKEYDLYIIDIRTPEMNGIDIVQRNS
jgi:YesN/AraC family two-component response regulator